MLTKTKKGGFTIIELLVAIAIIGVLSAVVLQSLMYARIKARDSQRLTEIRSMKIALGAYYNEVNGNYPSLGNDGTGYPMAGLATTLAPKYIGRIPIDPMGNTWNIYQYVRGVAGTNSYGILVRYEGKGYCKTGVNINPGWWGPLIPYCE